MRQVIERIKTDLRQNIQLIAVIAILWIVTELIFHQFCPVVIITGFPCPGCGLTRAFASFITLHPIRAFEYNPSYPLWVAMAVAFVIRRYVQGKTTRVLQFPMIIVCIVTIAVYVWRMTHVFPGKEPMVYYSGNLFCRIHPIYGQFVNNLIR